jgi:hypothetical protein
VTRGVASARCTMFVVQSLFSCHYQKHRDTVCLPVGVQDSPKLLNGGYGRGDLTTFINGSLAAEVLVLLAGLIYDCSGKGSVASCLLPSENRSPVARASVQGRGCNHICTSCF